MNGFANNPTLKVDRQFRFLNPKAGLSYQKNGWNAFLSYAIGNKEPNRDDFEAGANTQPNYENLQDLEWGIEKKTARFSAGATFYYMHYKNQLVLTGKINDVGAYTRVNTPQSYRMGIELQASASFNSWFNASGNLTLSRNKIKSFTEYIDNYDNGTQITVAHSNTDISFSPAVVSSLALNFIPAKQVELSLLNKSVGRQYLDNTQNKYRSLNGYIVQDLRAIYGFSWKKLKDAKIIFQLNNLFNERYQPNGYTFSYIYGGDFTTENYYYPMAGTNFMLAFNLRF
jgi:iron complex outermembrane receptor protein